MRCCNACKTPYFCGNRLCWCHAFQLDDHTLAGRTTYPDPTGYTTTRLELLEHRVREAITEALGDDDDQ